MQFIQSYFYKWTKAILWIVALIRIGLSQKLESAVIWLVVALGYTIVPWLIALLAAAPPASRSDIEKFKKTSPVVAYLDTLFDDISHINVISGDFGVKFDFAEITLSAFPSLHLHLTSDEDRIDFIQRYYDATVSWWRGEGGKSPEELQREFSGYFNYDKDGYTAKNVSFRKELEEESLSEVNHDSSGWYIDIRGLLVVNVGHNCTDKLTITAITECAEAHGYYSDHRDSRPDEYTMWIVFD